MSLALTDACPHECGASRTSDSCVSDCKVPTVPKVSSIDSIIINLALARLPDQVFAYTTYLDALMANSPSLRSYVLIGKYIEYMKGFGVVFNDNEECRRKNLEHALMYIRNKCGIIEDEYLRENVYTTTMRLDNMPVLLRLTSNGERFNIMIHYKTNKSTNYLYTNGIVYASNNLEEIINNRHKDTEYLSILIDINIFHHCVKFCHKCRKSMTDSKHSHIGKSCEAVHASHILPEICVVPAVIDDIICSYC